MYLLRHGTRSQERLCLERLLQPVIGMPDGWEHLAAVELEKIDSMRDEAVLEELELLRRKVWA